MRIVTTSWDDGAPEDLRLAELLRSRGIRGTFYIPINYHDRALDHGELRSLAASGCEIGAHGFSHKLLWRLSLQELHREIAPCKPILEDIIGREVRMFCYPRGRYDGRVVSALIDYGYRGARTVRMLATSPAFSPFEMPTTVQVFPHSSFTYMKNAARAGCVEGFQACFVHMRRLGNWLDLAKGFFDSVLENGGIWHLTGHSWEIERLDLWNDLREILDYVARREGVSYLTNGALVDRSLRSGPKRTFNSQGAVQIRSNNHVRNLRQAEL